MAGVELSTPVRIKASSTATTAVASSGKRHAFSDTMSGSGRTSGDGGMQGDSSCDLSSAGSVRGTRYGPIVRVTCACVHVCVASTEHAAECVRATRATCNTR